LDDDKLVVKTINNEKYIIHTTASSLKRLVCLQTSIPFRRKIKDANNFINSKLRNKQSAEIPVTENQLLKTYS
jgi:hypothetical protein